MLSKSLSVWSFMERVDFPTEEVEVDDECHPVHPVEAVSAGEEALEVHGSRRRLGVIAEVVGGAGRDGRERLQVRRWRGEI